MNADQMKKAAGEAAAQLVEPGMIVGLGTGSTAVHFVKALSERMKAGLEIKGAVATSTQTADYAQKLGIPLMDLNEAKQIDLTVDGADEIGPGLSLIKGGGGALLREKLVWESSKRCVVVADEGKVVENLGAFALPIEVVKFGHVTTSDCISSILADFGIEAELTLRHKDGVPFETDSGNYIYDAACEVIATTLTPEEEEEETLTEAEALGMQLKAITGVVEHGLFLGLADEAFVATEDGVKRLES